MAVVKTLRLVKVAGRNRVCEIDMVETPAGYLVNYRYGWEGSALGEGTRTKDAVTREHAEKILDSLRVSYAQRGYFEAGGRAGAMEENRPVRSRPAAVASPSGTPNRTPSRYEPGLLSRLENLPGLSDKEAAKLLFSIAQRKMEGALETLLNVAPTHDGVARRVLPYAIWRLGKAPWPQDARDLLATMAQSRDPACAQATRLVQAEIAGSLEGLGFHDPEAVAVILPTSQAAAVLARRSGACESLLTAYALARRDATMMEHFLDVLRHLPFEGETFRAVRRIFKAAEAFEDAQVFGVLAMRFETTKAASGQTAGGLQRFAGRIRGAREADRVAFGSTTRAYLGRRVWRHMRSLGGYGRTEYTALAARCLIEMPDKVYGQGLVQHITGVGHSDQRSEPWPELWDKAPERLLGVLSASANEQACAFAARALLHNTDFVRRLRPAVLARFLASNSASRGHFATIVAQQRIQAGQVDHALVAALLGAAHEEARALGWTAFALAPERWATPPQHLTPILMALRPEDCERMQAALSGVQVDGDALVKSVCERILALSAEHCTTTPPEFTPERATALAPMLGKLYRQSVCALPADTFAALTGHPRKAVRLFAMRLAAMRPDGIALFDPAPLLNDPDPSFKASAAALLAGAEIIHQRNACETIAVLAAWGDKEARAHARNAVASLATHSPDSARDIALALVHPAYQDSLEEDAAEELVALFGGRNRSAVEVGADVRENLCEAVANAGSDVVWSLLRARRETACRIGSQALQEMAPHDFSLRKLARIGVNDQKPARDWAVKALAVRGDEVAQTPQDIFTLLDGDWADSREAAYAMIRQRGSHSWPAEAIVALCDCTSAPAQAFGRELLSRALTPENAPAFLADLCEHPGSTFQLTLARLIREYAGAGSLRWSDVEGAMRRILQRPHASRAAKEQLWRFLDEQITNGTPERRAQIHGLLHDLSGSVVAADRSRAISALVALRARAPELFGAGSAANLQEVS